jgi:hypothetical protein
MTFLNLAGRDVSVNRGSAKRRPRDGGSFVALCTRDLITPRKQRANSAILYHRAGVSIGETKGKAPCPRKRQLKSLARRGEKSDVTARFAAGADKCTACSIRASAPR